MYNRYIPQSDGSYRRNRIPDITNEPPKQAYPPHREVPNETAPPPASCDQNTGVRPCQIGQPCPNSFPSPPKPPQKPRQNHSRESPPDLGIGSFLRRLLPSDFDAEDLLVILLLLLMAGDNQEDQNSALLTLALYLFL